MKNALMCTHSTPQGKNQMKSQLPENQHSLICCPQPIKTDTHFLIFKRLIKKVFFGPSIWKQLLCVKKKEATIYWGIDEPSRQWVREDCPAEKSTKSLSARDYDNEWCQRHLFPNDMFTLD